MLAQDNSKGSFIQDLFTKKLLTVYVDLLKKGVIIKKKQFYSVIEMPASNFNFIETGARNYPQDRRQKCKTSLWEKFGVNPEFLESKSNNMYVRVPEPITATPVLDTVQYNFKNMVEKKKVLDELEHYKKLAADLQAENKLLLAENARLKSQIKPDK